MNSHFFDKTKNGMSCSRERWLVEVYIYIYIYRKREREREIKTFVCFVQRKRWIFSKSLACVYHDGRVSEKHSASAIMATAVTQTR